MNPTEVLKKIKKIEIKSKHLVDGLAQGTYHSVFRGRGIEFSEVREYVVGDDARVIDWNVTARMNFPFVKEFVEERDLTVMVFFDISQSGDFGTGSLLKKEIGTELISSLILSAAKNNDRTGLLLASDNVEKVIPPRKGRRHALRLIREMVLHKRSSKLTKLKPSLMYLYKIMKKKGVVFIISDFIEDLKEIETPLRMLKKRHDLICIRIKDRREYELPDVGNVDLEDAETGEQITVDTSDPVFRERFFQLVKQREEKIKETMRKIKIDFIDIDTSGGWEKQIVKFFKVRERRRA